MVQGFLWMVLAYSLSQFYRASLAVFAPALSADIGLGADQVSTALGFWFLTFAAMQIPVGWLLDHRSPRKTASSLLVLGGGGGALVFAFSQSALGIYLGMALIGIGCSPVLMTAFYIFARRAAPERFGTLAGLILGIGSLGNVAASLPLTYALEAIGWRATMIALAVITIVIALALYRFVKDPPLLKRETPESKGTYKQLFTIFALYPVLIMSLVAYAPAAGLRGTWIGGYLSDIYALSAAHIGTATLFMALSMIAGSLFFGPIDRVIRSRLLIVAGSSTLTLLLILALYFGAGRHGATLTITLFVLIGFISANYSQIMNHARALLPETLVGRGVTLANLFSIGGAGLGQIVSGRLYANASAGGGSPLDGYRAVFGFFALALFIGVAIYTVANMRRRP